MTHLRRFRRHVSLAALAGLTVLAACSAREPSTAAAKTVDPAQWRFEPGLRFGPLLATSSEQDLIDAYGADEVQPESVSLGEGETRPGTVVFPADDYRRFEVAWADTIQRHTPEFVQLTGDSTLWRSVRGITLGTTLAELERLNGRPFGMAGYGWDYGGSVLSWKGGALADLEGRLALALAPANPDADVSHVLGDGEFLSSDSALRRLAPRVNRLIIRFE